MAHDIAKKDGGFYKWEVLILLWFAYWFNQADRQIYNALLPDIMPSLGMGASEAGLVATVFMWVLAVCFPFAGFAVDRFGKKGIIVASLVLWSAATVISGFCSAFFLFILFRCVATGVGEGFFAPAAYSSLSEYHDKDTRATAMGIFTTAQYLGIVICGVMATWLAKQWNDLKASGCLESLGFLVFNNAYLSQIANDKEKTLCLAKAHNIPVPETCFATKKTAIELARKLSFPLVIKPLDGHGGADVFMLQNEAELAALIPGYEHARFLLQRPVSELGKDLRVYVVGNRIIAGMLRSRADDFRSNYCLGGTASRYDFSAEELALVNRAISLFDVDYAGFDFMFDQGQMVLNEIEDVVGARMLYHETDIDIVALYLEHIMNKVQNTH